MALNAIDLAKKMEPIVDLIYKESAITANMDAATKPSFTNANEVSVLMVSTNGLGDYSRHTGYPKGNVTANWQTLVLEEERGKEFSVDRMDDEETLGLTFGTATSEFMRTHVAPEIDAYRFAKYAGHDGIQKVVAPAVLTKANIIATIDEAVRQLDEKEVPLSGRKLFLNSDLKPILNNALARQWGSDGAVNTVLSGYNDMPITWVPKSRFYTAITLNDGASNWGYTKAPGASEINFMIIYPQAILQVTKFAQPKIFSPDDNQSLDAWKFQYRHYHDAFVYQNKANGVYLHHKPATA